MVGYVSILQEREAKFDAAAAEGGEPLVSNWQRLVPWFAFGGDLLNRW